MPMGTLAHVRPDRGRGLHLEMRSLLARYVGCVADGSGQDNCGRT